MKSLSHAIDALAGHTGVMHGKVVSTTVDEYKAARLRFGAKLGGPGDRSPQAHPSAGASGASDASGDVDETARGVGSLLRQEPGDGLRHLGGQAGPLEGNKILGLGRPARISA